jgi:hypothetical protein
MKTVAPCAALVLLVSSLPPLALAGDAPPPWLTAVIAAPLPDYGDRVHAAELLRERVVRVEPDGHMVVTERGAIRVLAQEGRSSAACQAVYSVASGKVTSMRAWLTTPGKEPRAYGKKEAMDSQLAPGDVYNESRVRSIRAGDDASPGDTFGYEWTMEDRSVFAQFDWSFQGIDPVLASRFTLALPPGWRANAITMNGAPLVPAAGGETLIWELHDLPAIPIEPDGPPLSALASRLAVSLVPPDAAKTRGLATFTSWTDVSRWLSELADAQAEVDETLAARARELTWGSRTDLERVRAIVAFVQHVNYVSIQTGLGRGGGYRPHAAKDVLRNGYGDCKDKANLARALLKAAGIPSYLVSIYAGDPDYVREDWPSPQQFNHCILAVRAPADAPPAVRVEHPALGSLVIFDPTDPETPFGGLPTTLQGSLALVVAGDRGAIIRMPLAPPDSNRLERGIEATLSADGAIAGRMIEVSCGTAATSERALRHTSSESDYRQMIERWVARGMRSASVSRVTPADDFGAGRFRLEVEFAAQRYAQRVGARLITFQPALVSRREGLVFTALERHWPVVLDAEYEAEQVVITLPAGYSADDLPKAVELSTDFGRYRATCDVREGRLHFFRTMRLERAALPVARYAEVRTFFENVRRAETAIVVLKSAE